MARSTFEHLVKLPCLRSFVLFGVIALSARSAPDALGGLPI
jgi:hypothetical protein